MNETQISSFQKNWKTEQDQYKKPSQSSQDVLLWSFIVIVLF